MKILKKRKLIKKYNIIYFSVIIISMVLVIALSIVYSSLSTTLNISGDGMVSKSSVSGKNYYYKKVNWIGNFYTDESCVDAYKVKDSNNNYVTTMSEMVSLMSNNDKIYMMSKYIRDSTSETVTTNTNITIERHSSFNLDSMFLIYSEMTISAGTEGSVTINGSNINVPVQGGAFYNNGTLTLGKGINIINNKSAGSGGAIYSNGTLLTINNGVSFKNNISSVQGGAIYTTNSLNINTANFESNTSNNEGGALYLNGLTNSINNTTFKSNTSGSLGGAIWAGVNLDITSSEFTLNSAVNGGAIYFPYNTTTLTNCSITNNTITTTTGNGGGIYVGGTLNVVGKVIVNNNKKSDDTVSNVYLCYNWTIININSTLTSDTFIGITTLNKPTSTSDIDIAQGTNISSYVSCFSSDISGYYIKYSTSNSKIVLSTTQ